MPWSPRKRTTPRPREKHSKSTTERGYGWDWQCRRAAFLADNPLCQDCEAENIVTAATEVHHKRKIRHAPELRLEEENLMALCSRHHQQRTAKGE